MKKKEIWYLAAVLICIVLAAIITVHKEKMANVEGPNSTSSEDSLYNQPGDTDKKSNMPEEYPNDEPNLIDVGPNESPEEPN